MFNSKRSLISLTLMIAFFLLALFSSNADGSNPKNGIFKNISSEKALNLIEENRNNKDFIILDVRTPGEYESGHIKSAVNFDFYSETFIDDLKKLDKNKIYFIYCRSGNRSGNTLNIMKELDYKELYNLIGGITGWISNGYPTIK